MISGSRCCAKLHGIFKNAQRGSTDGRFFLLLGGSDQLVGNQIARFSSLGVAILSTVLSPGFDLNSNVVRCVLRDWIAHGDETALWMTRPLALSTVSCLLEACHQANVVGFFAELSNDTTCQSLAHCVKNKFVFQQLPMDMCAFGFPFKRRFKLVSVRVP